MRQELIFNMFAYFKPEKKFENNQIWGFRCLKYSTNERVPHLFEKRAVSSFFVGLDTYVPGWRRFFWVVSPTDSKNCQTSSQQKCASYVLRLKPNSKAETKSYKWMIQSYTVTDIIQGIYRHQTPPQYRNASGIVGYRTHRHIRPITAKRDVIHKTGST